MKARLFLGGMVTALLLAGLVGFLIVWSGLVSVSAVGDSWALDHILRFASSRSIHRHAPAQKNPFANDPAAVRVGLEHYRENCMACHGASGVDRAEFARGLNPPPPKLTAPSTWDASDGELYWVISNGIRSTGMPAFAPTHSKDEIWKIVSFVRHLRDLSDEELDELKRMGTGGESHHQSGH